MNFQRRWILLAVLIALFALPLLTNEYVQYVLNLVLVYVVVAIGMNFILGYTGLLAFAHVAFMGIGAYTTGLLMARIGLPFYVAVPAGTILATLAGLLVGVPALRVSGLYLAMVTFAFAELVRWVLINWRQVTLGVDGVTVPPARVFGWEVRGADDVYFVVLPVTLTLIALAKVIIDSKLGRAFVAVRDCEIAAQCSGIDIASTKIISFALSALFAGAGGALFALVVAFISPSSFGLFQLTLVFATVVIGGASTLAGSIIGAVLLTGLPEVLRQAQAWQEIIYGFLLVAFVIFAPKGIAGFLLARSWLPRELMIRNWREMVGKEDPDTRAEAEMRRDRVA